jgi:hypothetical protein
VPAAGLRWLIFVKPARISADHELSLACAEVLPGERLDAFTQLTGVDLRGLVAGVAAGYELGTLYVAALPTKDGGVGRARFAERLTAGAIVKHPRPSIYRIAGTRAGAPRAMVSVDDRLLAVAVDDLTLARVAEAYAERRLKSPTALRGAALASLPNPPDDALAVFYAPGPFTGEWQKAAGGLLRSAVGLYVSLQHGAGATLTTKLVVAGDWPDTDQTAQLESAWRELASGPTGRLFGLDQAKNVRIVADLHQLTWSAELPISALVAGLRAATVANVSEMFDVHAPEPTGSPAEPLPAP